MDEWWAKYLPAEFACHSLGCHPLPSQNEPTRWISCLPDMCTVTNADTSSCKWHCLSVTSCLTQCHHFLWLLEFSVTDQTKLCWLRLFFNQLTFGWRCYGRPLFTWKLAFSFWRPGKRDLLCRSMTARLCRARLFLLLSCLAQSLFKRLNVTQS